MEAETQARTEAESPEAKSEAGSDLGRVTDGDQQKPQDDNSESGWAKRAKRLQTFGPKKDYTKPSEWWIIL
jgi:hypothetical protein